MRLQVQLMTFPGCPHAGSTRRRLQAVLASLAPDAQLEEIKVRDPHEAAALGFQGSPSVRIDGVDLEGRAGDACFSCRLYEGTSGPPRWLLEAAVLRALRPERWLFLCVANSARSQLAEALARHLGPSSVHFASAGTAPTSVRPEVHQVLDEVGVDSEGLRSKSAGVIEGADVVITLCAEEACPTWLYASPQAHWALPDPAAVEGEGRLQAFRDTRDELMRRLGVALAMPAA